MTAVFLIFLLIIIILILASLSSLFYVVKQQSVVIIERFGKFTTIANSGFHFKLPFGIDRIAARVQLRLLQNDMNVETKTQDNVFVQMTVTEWEKFLDDYKRLKTIATFKERLKTAFKEIRQIQRGEKQGTTLTDFLNEL